MGWGPSGAKVRKSDGTGSGSGSWNGGTAILWMLLFVWRTIEYSSPGYACCLYGAINLRSSSAPPFPTV